MVFPGLADALITSITTRQQLWFIKGASILLTCLSGRRHPWIAKSKRRWNARAITWSTGLTATSLTGRYPTSVLATCRISSNVSSNKFLLIKRKELIDAGDTTRGKVELVCFEY